MRGGKSLALMALAALFLAPLWGCGSNRSSEGGETTARTPEEILRATSFVGADRCGACHAEIHAGWQQTAHTQKLRDGSLEVNYSNDGNTSGRADYFDGADIDIKTLPGGDSFASLGANAPVLGSDAGGAYVKIGASKYYIKYTLGGSALQSPSTADGNPDIPGSTKDGLILNAEAQWKQRYITMIGKSNYILPVQFNQQTQKYVTYDLSKWYSGTTPQEPVKNDSYERRCAGCHVTGLQVALEGDEWVMEFSDISVSCEACHGPGGQHATNPTKDNIINPETMTTTLDLNSDGTVDQIDNLIVRNYVCYPCHSRGEGKFSAAGTTLEYSSRPGTSGEALMYLPGLDWKAYYDITEAANDYWGGGPQSGDFITSKAHHQQQQDHNFGPHRADETEDHECFVCHDLHFADKEHLVAASLKRDGVTVDNSRSDNNNLCLTCHSNGTDHFIPEEFGGLTLGNINTGAGVVDTAMANHRVSRAYMPAGEADCTDCHMPMAVQTAIQTKFATGVAVGEQTIDLAVGDESSHTSNIIWPNYVMQSSTFSWTGFKKWWEDTGFTDPADGTAAFASVGPIPNSCMNTSCHRPGTEDDIVTQWFGSGHANGFGEPFNDWNADGEVSSRCVKCHTQGGYIQQVNGQPLTAQSNVFPKVLGCETCHEPNGGGQTFFEAGLVQNVTFPNGATLTLGNSSNICMECHQGRASGVTLKDNLESGSFGFVNRHYLAAAAILFGKEADAGFQYRDVAAYLGRNTYPGHGGTLNTCTSCHMREGAANHLFEPDMVRCQDCHVDSGTAFPGTLTNFNNLGLPFGGPDVDYDGDGNGESFQAEIDGVSAALLTAIQGYAKDVIGKPIVYGPGSYPYFFNDTNGNGILDPEENNRSNGYKSFDDTLLPAAYNYHSNQDPCSDHHNYKYVLQVAYDSLDDLDDGLQNNSVAGGIVRP